MMLVVIVHLDGATVGLPTPGSPAAVTAPDAWRIAVEAIAIIGVNCFTLISGYFGIRANMRGILRFTAICVFYSVGLYSLSAAAHPSAWSWGAWTESWMVYTHNDLWYVPAYMILYLLSPMLNAAADQLPTRKFGLWLGLFVVANVWCGWMWHANFNPTGYTPVQLVMMYLIGRYIARYDISADSSRRSRIRLWAGAAYVASTVATALIAIVMEPTMVYAYNSPWVIVESVAFFILFATLRLRSSWINNMAKGAFAVYLIHKNPAVWGGFVRPTAAMMWAKESLPLYSLFCVGFTLAIYAVSAFVDRLRAWLFGKVEALFDNKIEIETRK